MSSLVPYTPQRSDLPLTVADTASGMINLAEAQTLASAHSCGLQEALGEIEAREVEVWSLNL